MAVTRNNKRYEQEVFLVEWEDIPGRGVSNGQFLRVKTERGRPSRLWTFLLPAGAAKPVLPVTPVHNQNVFMEDHMHDWDYKQNTQEIEYYTRIFDRRSVWILVEWEVS